ncbi:MAG TPA: exodeoxyribonuclease VII large subunit, partial [Nitrospiria bacterium]|nr:exodeoxyribonuclease VII large subunit [Nitrospiria bacterium]
MDPPHSEEGEGPGESSISGRILTPTELTRLIRSHLERAFSDFWIEGEVGSLRAPGSGHIYFNLKDPSSQIKTVIFRSHGRFLRFTPKEGQWVLIRGHLSLYEARGEYELIVDYVEPKGAGALQAAFEALKERLSAEGLFDSSRKRPLPRLPGKIGIVTSPAGAALRDILKILRRRFFGLSILIAPVQVQGAGAPGEIARAIDELGERRDLDLLIVTRGGGSLEDLFAFNEEVVARAIARCSVPVISAVGHETDYTIADFVADLRAPTPSAAAEMAVPVREELMEGIHRFAAQLSLLVRHRLDDDRRRLEAECRLLQAPEQQVA